MKVRCFGCDASIEADGTDHVVDAFVVHGHERHTWSYREEAIRNYARNCAEASERLTGGTERLSEIGDVTVHPVSEDRVATGSGSSITTAFQATPIGPRAIASRPTCRRRPSNLSAPGARHGRP